MTTMKTGDKGWKDAIQDLREYDREALDHEKRYVKYVAKLKLRAKGKEGKEGKVEGPQYMTSPKFVRAPSTYFRTPIEKLVRSRDLVLFKCDNCEGVGIRAANTWGDEEKDPYGQGVFGESVVHGILDPDANRGGVFMLGHNGEAESTSYYDGDGDDEAMVTPGDSMEVCTFCEEGMWEHHDGALAGFDANGHAFGVQVSGRVMRASTGDNRALKTSLGDIYPWDIARAIGRQTGWVKTDAWRGHHSTPKKVKVDSDGEWVKVVDTWACPMGNTDAATAHAAPLEETYKAMKAHGSPIPCVWDFTPTSNLFSVGLDLYVMKKDVDAMLQYLRGEGASDRVLVVMEE